VLHGVDGTRLDGHKALARWAYSRVVFNYPHTGAGIKDRDRNIRAQQEMVRGFLGAASRLLRRQRVVSGVRRSVLVRSRDAPLTGGRRRGSAGREESSGDEDGGGGVVEPAAVASQLEPEIHVTLRTGEPYDAWNIKGLGRSVPGLVSAESFRFEPGKYPGYRHVRTLGVGVGVGADADAGNKDEDEEDFLKKPAKTFVFRLERAGPVK
jgi:25S rRNA (uracil2634-N3)-methyltransferase